MDDNKLIKLREIDYTLNKVCGLCEHGTFPNDEWGTCSVHTYDHKKHDGIHNLSVHKFGSCNKFKMNDSEAASVAHYREFI